MDGNEIRFWIVIGIMAFFGGLGFLARLAIWAVFHFGANGKLKVRVVIADEKGEETSNDSPLR